MVDPEIKKREPPIQFPGLEAPSDEVSITRVRTLLIGSLAVYLLWTVVRVLVTVAPCQISAPRLAWHPNAAQVAGSATPLGHPPRGVVWGVYLSASIASTFALIGFCGTSVLFMNVVPVERIVIVFQVVELGFFVLIAVLGFKYGGMLRISESVRLAREHASSKQVGGK